MEFVNKALVFFEGLHISAIVIIALIIAVFLLAIAFNFTLRAKYKKMHKELDRQAAVSKSALPARGAPEEAPVHDRFAQPRFKNQLLKAVASDYETAWNARKGQDVNTQAIIENQFNVRLKAALLQERFARQSVSIMIVLGLLGTFIGLTLSVQSLVLLFRGYDVTELLSSVESGLLSALAGMSTAFTTSLFGIACSVLITIINIFISPERSRERLMTGLEEYLDNTASARLGSALGDGYEKMNESLRNTFVNFGDKIAERFDRVLLTLREDIRGIDDVNNNLRNTIEQMDVCFVRVADALKGSTKHVEDNYQALSALSEQLADAGAEFQFARKENARHSEDLIASVTEAARSIDALTGDLRGEAQLRLENFSTYEAAIAQMARSAELIRVAVAAIPEQMYAYSEASALPPFTRGREDADRRETPLRHRRDRRDSLNVINELNKVVTFDEGHSGGESFESGRHDEEPDFGGAAPQYEDNEEGPPDDGETPPFGGGWSDRS